MRILIASLCVLVTSLSAMAQQPQAPIYYNPVQQVQAAPVAPAPMPQAQAMPAHPAAPMVVSSGPGCNSCGASIANCDCKKPGFFKRLINRFSIGEGCESPVCCGNFASTRTFLFGSCRQFFNAGNKCGAMSGLFGSCNTCGCAGSCNNGSFLNR